MRNLLLTCAAFIGLLNLTQPVQSQVLNKDALLQKFDFWHNKDWHWYKKNIPFFESPDPELDLTYYYRWDMATLHFVYGSPQTGYAVTEFIDRPWWAGTYGVISCSVGHHLYDLRWLRDPTYMENYTRYWFHTPGAQPRSYSTWLADASWQFYKVTYNKPFIMDLTKDFVKNFRTWEEEHWVESEGMFAWSGMHDGMETNINSRQTPQWFEGASGYRPTLNSYLWADARAISQMARLTSDETTAQTFDAKADRIKTNFLSKCWDPKRNFFIHKFEKDEAGGIKANTFTYETGKYAGNPHGREEIGFIPWFFRMPDAGFESAWKYLMDSTRFYAPYGPTTVEKGDPLYLVAPNCCVWSGNAWPFATSQTLKAMANVVRYYDQPYVTKTDYYKMLRNYALTHRKAGQPFIAEANHPETGSWDGHDVQGHSEHYFHSSYTDLIITGLMGLEPMATDSVEINPLIPENWAYCCLDDVPYHGHSLSIVWDRTGERYHKGKGFSVLADGQVIAHAATVQKMIIPLKAKVQPAPAPVMNYAVNNEPDLEYPKASTSSVGVGYNLVSKLNDGQYWYLTSTPNRWVSSRPATQQEWVSMDLGQDRTLHQVVLYPIVDSTARIRLPKNVQLQIWNGKSWQKVSGQQVPVLQDSRANVITFPAQNVRKFRVLLDKQPDSFVGLSELEAWGPADAAFKAPETRVKPDTRNLASNALFSFSYRSKFDDTQAPNGINDGKLDPARRWTAYESPNTSDWVEVTLKEPKTIGEAHLYVFDDKGGTRPPLSYAVEYWNGKQWQAVANPVFLPEKPVAHLNVCSFKPVKTRRIRVKLTHANPARKIFSGLYELALYESN